MKKKKTFLVKVIAVCMSIILGMSFLPTTYFAEVPTMDTKFKKLKLGSNQLKDSDYNALKEDLAGYFKAPASGKYSIYVVNNGALRQSVGILDKDFSQIAFVRAINSTSKYTFKTISLKKNEKIYIYIDNPDYWEDGSLMSKVVIKQVSKEPTLNKTTLSLKKGKSYTLKLKNNKNDIIWVSSDKSIATVSSKGVIKAKKKGTVYIYAIANHKLYKCKVTVKK